MAEKNKPSAWRFLWTSEDIRRKLLITLGILLIFRIAANVPAPGVDRGHDAIEQLFAPPANDHGGLFLGKAVCRRFPDA